MNETRRCGLLLFVWLVNNLSRVACHELPRPVAHSPSGSFAGYVKVSSDGRYFGAFSGIRYAQPPLGRLRFKPPVPIKPKIGIQNAVIEGPDCTQINYLQPLGNTRIVTGAEDCLFLNVYTHDVLGRAPVMLWIPFGIWRFSSGSQRNFGPDFIMNEDVVLVTMNYRLGPLGFASLGNRILPGNMGIKDQEEAIRWVKRNIAAFGGDPDQITLFGQSAGAVSTLFHLKGRMGGLVHRGIAQSGSTLSPWAYGPPHLIRRSTVNLATVVGCNFFTSDIDILNCLRGKSAEELVGSVPRVSLFAVVNNQDFPAFRPVIEPGGPIPVDPWYAKPSHHPIMIGQTSYEAGFFIAGLGRFRRLAHKLLRLAFNYFAPKIFLYESTAPNRDVISNRIWNYYLDNLPSTMREVKRIVAATTDAWYTFPIHLEKIRHRGPLLSFVFDYVGFTTLFDLQGARDLRYGPGHIDDVPYLFRMPVLDIMRRGSPSDRRKSREMVKMWTDFAKGLDPTPHDVLGNNWEQKSRDFGYLLITNNASVVIDKFHSPFVHRIKFWSRLPLGH